MYATILTVLLVVGQVRVWHDRSGWEEPMADPVYENVDGNWNNTANWSTGAVPVSTDRAWILEGSTDLTSNLNQTTVDLALLYIGKGYKGNIGVSGTPLQIGATTLVNYSSGTHYLTGDAAGNRFDYIINRGLQGTVILDGFAQYIKNEAGAMTINGGMAISALVSNLTNQANTTIQVAASSTIPTLRVRAGVVTLHRNVTTDVSLTGGELICTGEADHAGANVIQEGGIHRYRPTVSPSPITRFELLDGVLDLSELEFANNAGLMVIGPTAHVVESPLFTLGASLKIDLRQNVPVE
jgi:acyl-coenzyme A thioesterase PaaI-like protein